MWGLVDLDFAALARGFALLRLPKMPELRGKTFPDFEETAVDTDAIRYKDKNRERQRQKQLKERTETTETNRRKFVRNQAWSKQKAKKERRRRVTAKRRHEQVPITNQ